MKIPLSIHHRPEPASRAQFVHALRALLAEYEPAIKDAGLRIAIEDLKAHEPGLTDRDLVQIVADYVAIAYGIESHLILQTNGKTRLQKVAEARHVAMIFVQEYTELMDGEVSRFFKLERSLVAYARKWISGTCDVDPVFNSSLTQMRAELTIIIATAKAQNPPKTFAALARHARLPRRRHWKKNSVRSVSSANSV